MLIVTLYSESYDTIANARIMWRFRFLQWDPHFDESSLSQTNRIGYINIRGFIVKTNIRQKIPVSIEPGTSAICV